MLNDILEILKNSEADAWEVTDTKTEGWEFYFITHALDQNRIRNVEHINVRVYKLIEEGQFMGMADAEIAPTETRENIEKTVHDLVYRASLVRNKPYTLNVPVEAESKESALPEISSVAKDFIEVLRDIEESEVSDLNSYEIFVNRNERRFLNSNGIDITSKGIACELEVVTNARNEKHEIELHRIYKNGGCDKEALKNDIVRTMNCGLDRLHTVSTPHLNKYPVVFSTRDALEIYRYFLSRINAQMIYMQMSDAKIDQPLSDEIRGDKVTIESVRELKNSSMNGTFDQEGALIKEITLMKDSTPKALFGSKMFASYIGIEDSFDVQNYVVSGGTRSEEEIRDGKYLEVVEFSHFQVSETNGDIFGEIRLGYYHDGEKVTPVTGGSVTGNMKDYLKEMYMSKETAQYNNALIPSVTKLMNVTVAGSDH